MAVPNNSRPKWGEVEALPSFQELDLDKKVSVLDLWLKETKDAGVKEGWWDKGESDKGDEFAAKKRREIVGRLAEFDPEQLGKAANVITEKEPSLFQRVLSPDPNRAGAVSPALPAFDKFNPQPLPETPDDQKLSPFSQLTGLGVERGKKDFDEARQTEAQTRGSYSDLVNSYKDPDVRQAFVQQADSLSKLNRKQVEGVVLNGRVVVHPDNQLDQTNFETAVNATEGATDAQKRDAMQSFPLLREQQGGVLAKTLRDNDEGFRTFEAAAGGSEADKVEAYREKIGTFGALGKQVYSGVFESFWRSAVQPIVGAAAGATSAVDSVLGDTPSDLTKGLLETAQGMSQELSRAREYRAALGPGLPVVGDPGEVISAAGSLVPSLGAGFGLGAAARAGTALASTPLKNRIASTLTQRGVAPQRANEMAKRLLPKTVDDAVSNISFGGAVAAAGAQSYGGTFIDAYDAYFKQNVERGSGVLSEDEMKQDALNRAQLPALTAGVVTALVTGGFGKTGVDAIFKASKDSGFKAALGRIFKEAGLEAVEEGTDQFVQGLVSSVTYRPEATLGDIVGEAMTAALYGGILGGGVNAINQSVRGITAAIFSRRADQAEETGSPITASVLRERANQAGDQVVQEQAERAKEAARAVLDALGDQDTSSASGVSDPATTTPTPAASEAKAAASGDGALKVGDSFNYSGSRGGEAGSRVITEVATVGSETTPDSNPLRTQISFGDRDATGALIFVDPNFDEAPASDTATPTPTPEPAVADSTATVAPAPEPVVAEPTATVTPAPEPAVVEPTATVTPAPEPAVVEPTATVTPSPEPVVADPAATGPAVTEPIVADSTATVTPVSEPVVAASATAEPAAVVTPTNPVVADAPASEPVSTPEQLAMAGRVEELLAEGSLVRQPDGRVEVPDALVDELSGDQIRELTALANEFNSNAANRSGNVDAEFETAVDGLDAERQAKVAERTAQFLETESNREGNQVIGEDGQPVRLTFGQALDSLLAQAQAVPRVRGLLDKNPELTQDDLQEVATRWFLDIAGSKWFDPSKASLTTTFVGRFADRLSNYVTRDRAFIDRKKLPSLQEEQGDGNTRGSKIAAEETPSGPQVLPNQGARTTAQARQVMLATRRDARRLLNEDLAKRSPEYKEAVRSLLQGDEQLGALVEKEKGFAVKYRREPAPEIAEKAAKLLAENNDELREIVADAAAKASLLNRGETMPMTRELAASIAKNLVEGGINNAGTIDAAAITNGVTKDVVRRVKSWLLGNAAVTPDEDFPVTPRSTAGATPDIFSRNLDENFDLLEQGWGDRFLQVGSQVDRLPAAAESSNARDLVDIKAGDKVRIVFAEEVNEAKARILRLGAPAPETLTDENYRDLFTVGLDLFAKGATDLAAFTQQLVTAVGDWVRSVAQRLFNDVQRFSAAVPNPTAEHENTLRELRKSFFAGTSQSGETFAQPLRAFGVPKLFTDRLAGLDRAQARPAYASIIRILDAPFIATYDITVKASLRNLGITEAQAVQEAESFRENSYVFQVFRQLDFDVRFFFNDDNTTPNTQVSYVPYYGLADGSKVRESFKVNFNITQILKRAAVTGAAKNEVVVRRMVNRAIAEELLHAAHVSNEFDRWVSQDPNSDETIEVFSEFMNERMMSVLNDMLRVVDTLGSGRDKAVDRLLQTLSDSLNIYNANPRYTTKATVIRTLSKASPDQITIAVAEFVRQLAQLKQDGVVTEELLAFFYANPTEDQVAKSGNGAKAALQVFREAVDSLLSFFQRAYDRMKSALQSMDRGEFGDAIKLTVDGTLDLYNQVTELAAKLERQAGVADRGVNVEVAPNPDDAVSVAKWNTLDEDQKRKATRDIGDKVLPELLKQMELRGTIQYEEGGFDGKINPSIYVAFGPETTFEEIRQFGIASGAVMRQQAVIVFDESQTTGADMASHFRVTPNRELSLDELTQFYTALIADFPEASGFARRSGSLVFGNFSEVDDATFKAKLKTAAARAAKAQGFKLSLTEATFQSLYLDQLNDKFKQTEIGQRTAAIQQSSSRGGSKRRVAGGPESTTGRNALRGPGSPTDVLTLFSDSFEQTTAGVQTGNDGGVRTKARAGSGRSVQLGVTDPERGLSPARKGTFQLFKDKWVNLTHWSGRDNLKQTDPKKHGTYGAGQESSRKRDYRKEWVDRTYSAFGSYTRERMIGGQRYSLRVDGNRIYDYNKDPEDLFPTREELRKRGYAPFDDGAANTIYEKRIRDKGYLGFVNSRLKVAALFEKAPATKVAPSEKTVRLSAAVPTSQADMETRLLKRLAKNIKPSRLRVFKEQRKYLSDAERQNFRQDTVESFVDIIRKLPSVEDFAAAALGGQAKRGWYENSARALIEVFGLVDAPRFAALLAALSPQTSVENNLENTLNVWKNWDAAGRPTDRRAILAIMGNSVSGSRGEDSVLPAWINNSLRALTSPNPEELTISGPKVNSFMLNLRGVVNEVTNDAWMANFALVDQTIFSGSMNKSGTNPGKGPGYLAMSARVRAAADYLSELTGETWTPAEVQETVWSWAKTLYELQDRAGEQRTAEGILRDGDLTDDAIASTPDFATLLNNGNYRQILTEAGYGDALENLAERTAQPAASTQRRFTPEAGSAVEETIRAGQERSASRLTRLYEQRRAKKQKTRTRLAAAVPQEPPPQQAARLTAQEAEAQLVDELKQQLGNNATVEVTDGGSSPAEVQWSPDGTATVYVSREQLERLVKGRGRLSAAAAITKIADEEVDHIAAVKALGLEKIMAVGRRLSPEEREAVAKRYIQRGNFDTDAAYEEAVKVMAGTASGMSEAEVNEALLIIGAEHLRQVGQKARSGETTEDTYRHFNDPSFIASALNYLSKLVAQLQERLRLQFDPALQREIENINAVRRELAALPAVADQAQAELESSGILRNQAKRLLDFSEGQTAQTFSDRERRTTRSLLRALIAQDDDLARTLLSRDYVADFYEEDNYIAESYIRSLIDQGLEIEEVAARLRGETLPEGMTTTQLILAKAQFNRRIYAAIQTIEDEAMRTGNVDQRAVARYLRDIRKDSMHDLQEIGTRFGQGLRVFREVNDQLDPFGALEALNGGLRRTHKEIIGADASMRALFVRLRTAIEGGASAALGDVSDLISKLVVNTSQGTVKQKRLLLDVIKSLYEIYGDKQRSRGRKADTAIPVMDRYVQDLSSKISNLLLADIKGPSSGPVLQLVANQIKGVVQAAIKQELKAVTEAELKVSLTEAELEAKLEQAKDNQTQRILERLSQAILTRPWAEKALNETRRQIMRDIDQRRAEGKAVNLSDSQIATLQEVRLGDVLADNGLSGVVRRALVFREEIRKHITSRETSQEMLVNFLLDKFDVSPNVAETVADAIRTTYLTEVQRAIKETADRAIKEANTPPKIKAVAKSSMQNILELANMGTFSEEAFYNAVAKTFRLPQYNKAFSESVEREADRIQRMPANSDARADAGNRLLAQISKKHIDTLKATDVRAWLKLYFLEIPLAVWQASVLSGVPTQLINASMSNLNVLMRSLSSASAYAMADKGATFADRAAYFADAIFGYLNTLGVTGADGPNAITTAWRKGVATGSTRFRNEKADEFGVLEKANIPALTFHKYVGRIMVAADAGNASIASEVKSRMALRYAVSTGAVEANKDLLEELLNPSDSAVQSAKLQAQTEAKAGLFDPSDIDLAGLKGEARKARIANLREIGINNRIIELVEQRRFEIMPDLKRQARSAGESWTFNEQAKGLMGEVLSGAIGKINRDWVVTKFMFSFMNTLANLLNAALDFSPVGILRAYNVSPSSLLLPTTSPYRWDIDAKGDKRPVEVGSPEFFEKVLFGVAGSLTYAAVALLTYLGFEDEEEGKEPFFAVFGGGPTDKAQRQQLEAGGWQANTVKIGDIKLRYQDLPAINLVLSVLGAISDVYRYERGNDKTWQDKASTAAFGVVNVVTSKNLFQGASNLFRFMSGDPNQTQNAAASLLSGAAGGFTNPQLFRWLRSTFDIGEDGMVKQLDYSTTEGWLYSMVPFSLGYDKAAVDYRGNEIKQYPWAATARRFGVIDPRPLNETDALLVQSGLRITGPSKNTELVLPTKDGQGVRQIPVGRHGDVWRAFQVYRGEFIDQTFTPALVKELVAAAEQDKDAVQTAISNKIGPKANAYAKAKVQQDIADRKLRVPAE